MCFQAIAELAGSALGLFVFVFLVIIAIFIGGALIFGLLMALIGAFVWLITNPVVWIIFIIIILFFIFNK